MRTVSEMTQTLTGEQLLEKLAFLVGDWRGTGELQYPGTPPQDSSYDILAMCKWTPDKSQLMLLTFNNDPQNNTMFHATQAFIYVDPESGQFRIRRSWLMESEPEGFVTVERLAQKSDKSFGFTVVEREGVPATFHHEGTIEHVSDTEIVISGAARVESRKYPYVDKYHRRPSPSR